MIITEEAYLEHYGRLGMKWYQHKFGEEDGRAKYLQKTSERSERTGAKIKKSLAKEESERQNPKFRTKLKSAFIDPIYKPTRNSIRGARPFQSKEQYDAVNKTVNDYFKRHFKVPVLSKLNARLYVQNFLGEFGEVPSAQMLEYSNKYTNVG